MSRSRARNTPTKPQHSPGGAHGQGTVIAHQETKFHHGPLPSPEVLRDYDLMIPGSAERIIQMAERQAEHRQELELTSLNADIEARDNQLAAEQARVSGIIWNERIGQILGWTVAAACVGGAVLGMVRGASPITIGLFLSLPVAGMIKALRSGNHK
ncbi:DUF2335 domain-containing protein [Burkholderia arboris]|uniref:DUF2335 domain-containing protein n=1 Tax=Burkholderia arboris TaxID=488730 RepID=UPI001CF17416|nr:DUF2335 domain-containing protein [Burkholderia arboris]MCA8037114.1 DUF2335 domain-containing protein [Burkholderia arboris]